MEERIDMGKRVACHHYLLYITTRYRFSAVFELYTFKISTLHHLLYLMTLYPLTRLILDTSTLKSLSSILYYLLTTLLTQNWQQSLKPCTFTCKEAAPSSHTEQPTPSQKQYALYADRHKSSLCTSVCACCPSIVTSTCWWQHLISQSMVNAWSWPLSSPRTAEICFFIDRIVQPLILSATVHAYFYIVGDGGTEGVWGRWKNGRGWREGRTEGTKRLREKNWGN